MDTGNQIAQSRSIIRERNQEPDGGATTKTLQRLKQVAEVFDAKGINRYPNWWLDNLGCAVSEQVVREALAKVDGADFADCTNDAEVRRIAVTTVMGSEFNEASDEEVSRVFAQLRFHGREAV